MDRSAGRGSVSITFLWCGRSSERRGGLLGCGGRGARLGRYASQCRVGIAQVSRQGIERERRKKDKGRRACSERDILRAEEKERDHGGRETAVIVTRWALPL